jgi:hypothetical protein
MADAARESVRNSLPRCERCWSTDDVQLFRFMATGEMTRNDDETGIPLCNECRKKAPRDPLVFKEIFLRFGSPKELLSAYSAHSEEEAIGKLCAERRLDYANMMTRLSGSAAAARIGAELAGEKTGGKMAHLMGPFGYHYDDSGLAVNETEAKVVLEIFNLYMNGLGIAKICRELNRRGHRTRTGKAWASQTVANILSNPIYCGFMRVNGDLKAGKHRHLVQVGVFNRVQEEMQRRIRRPDQKSDNCLTLPQKEAQLGESQ